MRRSTLLAALCFAMPLAAQYGESIDVVRYVVPARVDARRRDHRSHCRGFLGDDRRKEGGGRVGGWLGGVGDGGTPEAQRAGRLIVVFVQTDFARNPVRVIGQMKFNELATILEMLEPEDFVGGVARLASQAAVRFHARPRSCARGDSRSDRIRRMELPPPPDTGPCSRGISIQEMRDASSVGDALRFVATALQANEGNKLVIVGGWGIGRLPIAASFSIARGATRCSASNDRTPVITLGTGMRGGVLSLDSPPPRRRRAGSTPARRISRAEHDAAARRAHRLLRARPAPRWPLLPGE
jgi:hypothetical protein